MIDVLNWWVLLEVIGVAVWPVAFRVFRNLPDRGYAFIKPLGLLLIAYPFWLLTTLGFLTNTRGAVIAVAVVVAAASWWLARRPMNDESLSLLKWARQNKTSLIVTELVFTVAFIAWAFVRAHNPEISATEKPMEFAFLNGVLQSDHFPPLDPWLSGYAISYYYFGYLIVALLTLLSGVASSVAFNLAIASWFALAATGAFGLAYNLIQNSKLEIRRTTALFFSLFAPVFLLVIGNLEGLFESLHAKGLGSADFWNWLDVKGLAQASVTQTFVPMDNWWWWRASRVIHDVVAGQTQEVIDEFPQFSFLLGDLHPHLLALPFVLLALALALDLLQTNGASEKSKVTRLANFEFEWFPVSFLLLPLILGGLFFLNSWDILPYGFILVAAYALARYRMASQWDARAARALIVFVVALGAASVILYLPFFISFQSQAGGLLPVLFVKTRLHQFLIMFGLFVFILGALFARLIWERRDIRARDWLSRATPIWLGVLAFPLLVAAFALVVVGLSPALQDQVRGVLPTLGDNVLAGVIAAYLGPWLADPWLFVLLALIFAATLLLLREYLVDHSTTFVLLIVFTAFLLTFGVEFVYLRDQFGTRMNTVFKFYFQTWTLLAIASAYAVFYLSQTLRGVARVAWFVGLAMFLGASLIYPTFALPNRTNDFRNPGTLDGMAWVRDYNPSDYAAIQWLAANAPRGAVTLEAPGKEYSYDNRISMATGLPTVLGWAGHESQWRGGSKQFKDDATGVDRAADVQRIYQTLDAKELLTLLDKYAIKFVVVGALEREQYGLAKSQIDKFGKVMPLVFENGDVRIYGRSN